MPTKNTALGTGLVVSFIFLFSIGLPASSHRASGAAPADLQADVESLDSLLKALYESLSFPEGKGPDWERFQNLFASANTPCVRMTPGAILVTDLSGFLTNFSGRVKSGALKSFIEEEIDRTTESFGNIAQVFSTYRKGMNTADSQKFVRGVNSLQVFFKDGRWWIASLTWQDETPDYPIPQKYSK